MNSGIYCYLQNKEDYAEIIKFRERYDQLFVFFPTDEEDIKKKLPDTSAPHLLLFDPETLSLADAEILTKFSNNKNLIIALISAEDENDENIKFFKLSPSIGHLIPYKNKSIADEIEKLLMILTAADNQTGLESTVEKVLGSLEDKVSLKLSESRERWACYEELEKYTKKLEAFSDFTSIVKTAASELITNAFYDAPKNPETGKSLNPNRKSKVSLVPPRQVEVTYGLSGDYFWLFVRDPFGTLDKPTVIASLLRAATERAPKLDIEGGAGLGLKMVYEWASELVFGLAEGESTLVGCKLRITKRNRVFDAELASLHICVKP